MIEPWRVLVPLALALVACEGSPVGGATDAANDGDAVDAPMVGGTCRVIASFELDWGLFEVAATPTGWIATGSDSDDVSLVVVSTSGHVTTDPTPVAAGERLKAPIAVNGDRALVAVGDAVQARNLDGSVAGPLVPFAGSVPGMRAVGVVAGPGDGFRVLRQAAYADMEASDWVITYEISYHDRDGGFLSLGETSQMRSYGFDGAIVSGDEIVAPYRKRRSIGGCNACSTSGLARFDAAGSVSSLAEIPAEYGRAAVINSLSAAGEQIYFTWALKMKSNGALEMHLARSPSDIVLTEGEAGLTVVATGPRTGLLARSTPSLKMLHRFDDSAGFSLGGECELRIVPRALDVSGSFVLVRDSFNFSAQIVLAP